MELKRVKRLYINKDFYKYLVDLFLQLDTFGAIVNTSGIHIWQWRHWYLSRPLLKALETIYGLTLQNIFKNRKNSWNTI